MVFQESDNLFRNSAFVDNFGGCEISLSSMNLLAKSYTTETCTHSVGRSF